MSFLPSSRTRRNLFKVASLGLAGLLAGLLAGCNDASGATVSYARTSTCESSQEHRSHADSRAPPSPLFAQPPVPHRLHVGLQQSQSFLATASNSPRNIRGTENSKSVKPGGSPQNQGCRFFISRARLL